MIKDIKIGDMIGLHHKVIKICGGEGKSSFGIVYICKEIRYGIIFALKTFQDNVIQDNCECIQLFKNEAWNWINLNEHPNIVAAYDYLIQDYRPFLRLEAICPKNGKQSLTDYLYDNLEENQIIDWAIQFSFGMEYANSHGVIAHKDLKPDNILIKNNVLKISDFGLSDFIDETFKLNHDNKIQYKGFTGTPAYSAPECFKQQYSVQSDIYSFGIIFYQMINNGILPFYSDTFKGWEILHKTKKPKELNSELWPIISKCLEKDPEDRYENFNELKTDLINLYSKKSDKPHYKPIITQYTNILEDYAEKNLNFGFMEKAEIEYKKAIEENPNNLILRFNFAVSLLNNGKIEESKNIFKELENKKFLIPELYYNLGNIYQIEEEHDKSIEYYRKAIDVSIDNFDYLDAYINIANEFSTIGELLKSIIYLKKALSLKPKCLIIINNLTLSYMKNNNFKEAKELFKNFQKNILNNDFIGNQKEVSGFYFNWGKLYLRENNYQKAFVMFKEAVTRNCDNIEAQLDLMYTEIKFGIDKEDELNELILKFNDNRFKFLLGNLYFIKEKFEEGMNIYNQIIENFDSITGFFMLEYLLSHKEYLKCLISFNKFINEKLEEDDRDIISLTFKGMLYLENNNFEEAEKTLDNVLEIEPKNDIEERYLEVFLYSMGGC